MLSDILSRLVETVAEQGEDMQVKLSFYIFHFDLIAENRNAFIWFTLLRDT